MQNQIFVPVNECEGGKEQRKFGYETISHVLFLKLHFDAKCHLNYAAIMASIRPRVYFPSRFFKGSQVNHIHICPCGNNSWWYKSSWEPAQQIFHRNISKPIIQDIGQQILEMKSMMKTDFLTELWLCGGCIMSSTFIVFCNKIYCGWCSFTVAEGWTSEKLIKRKDTDFCKAMNTVVI